MNKIYNDCDDNGCKDSNVTYVCTNKKQNCEHDKRTQNCESQNKTQNCESHDKKHNCECIRAEFVQGNSIDIDVCKDDSEIRADLTVAIKRSVRIWGQVKDCDGHPVSCALVKLLRPIIVCGKTEFEGVAHGVTDCMGFYQFDICDCDCNSNKKFRVIVSKAATGKERVIDTCESLCDPCNPKNDCCKC